MSKIEVLPDVSIERVSESTDTTIYCLNRLLGLRDPLTRHHCGRVGNLAYLIAKALCFNEDFCLNVADAASLHDIGKLVIPLSILLKSTALSVEEHRLVETHTSVGSAILGGTGDTRLDLAAEVALHHHEKYDGSGYPKGLWGKTIPLSGRIVGLCDVYDNLRDDRPYSRRKSHDEAIFTIVNGGGDIFPGHFDPKILDVFLRNSFRVKGMYEKSMPELDRIE